MLGCHIYTLILSFIMITFLLFSDSFIKNGFIGFNEHIWIINIKINNYTKNYIYYRFFECFDFFNKLKI